MIFTSYAAGPGAGISSSVSNSVPMDVDFNITRPFAVVDEITEQSPAAEDGLQLGDQILKFGNVEKGENLLQLLASEAQQRQGEAVPLIVTRQGSLVNLTVTPRTWSGRGLLGYVMFLNCSFILSVFSVGMTSCSLLLLRYVVRYLKSVPCMLNLYDKYESWLDM